MQVELRAGLQWVLVVDAVTRKGIQSILGAWLEFQVSGEAANGEEAVLLTRDLKPDIVLTDISMPGRGGLEATRAIRTVLSGRQGADAHVA